MTDAPVLFEPDEYFARVERHFGLRRGGPLMLSPRDWQRVEKWQDDGVPLQVVLAGINRAFDQLAMEPGKRQINSLRYCAQHVAEAWEEHREHLAAAGVGDTVDPAAAHLLAAAASCRAAGAAAKAQDRKRLDTAAAELEELAAEATELAPAELDERATAIERRLEEQLGARPDRPLPRFSPWAL